MALAEASKSTISGRSRSATKNALGRLAHSRLANDWACESDNENVPFVREWPSNRGP